MFQQEGRNYGYVNQRMFDAGRSRVRPLALRSWPTARQCGEVGGFGCYQVSYFSNPELTYNGDPMGVPADHPSTGVDGPADGGGKPERPAGDHGKLPSKLDFSHAEGASDAVTVLAIREWGRQHGEGDVAQAFKCRHRNNDIGLADGRCHSK